MSEEREAKGNSTALGNELIEELVRAKTMPERDTVLHSEAVSIFWGIGVELRSVSAFSL